MVFVSYWTAATTTSLGRTRAAVPAAGVVLLRFLDRDGSVSVVHTRITTQYIFVACCFFVLFLSGYILLNSYYSVAVSIRKSEVRGGEGGAGRDK